MVRRTIMYASPCPRNLSCATSNLRVVGGFNQRRVFKGSGFASSCIQISNYYCQVAKGHPWHKKRAFLSDYSCFKPPAKGHSWYGVVDL